MHPIALITAVLAIALAKPADKALVLPPVHEVQRVAIEHAQIDVKEARGWQRKARRAALVPKVQIDYGYRFKNNINIDINDNVYVGASGVVVGPEDGSYSSVGTRDNNVGVRAVWEFGEAVFSAKELAASAEARRVVGFRNAIIEDVARRYYSIAEFRREAVLLTRMKAVAKDPSVVEHKIFLRKVACEEAAAALDGQTGGWFMNAVQGEPCREDS